MKKYQEEIEQLRRMLAEADDDGDDESDSGSEEADSDADDVVVGDDQNAGADGPRHKTRQNSQTNLHAQSGVPVTRKVNY